MSCLNHRGHIIADYSGIIANSSLLQRKIRRISTDIAKLILKKVANILATFFSISTFKTIRINQNDSYELFRSQNQLLRCHLFSHYRESYLCRLITGAQYYEGGTLEEMALNGFLQLGLSDMKFIRCDVSIIHRRCRWVEIAPTFYRK